MTVGPACQARDAREAGDDKPRLGQWYWKQTEDRDEDDDEEWLGCVVHVGTNYVALEGVEPRYTTRVHLDEFYKICRREADPEAYVNGKVAHYRTRSRQLLGEIADLTARLSVSPRASLQGSGEQALAVCGDGRPVEEYKKALILAKETTLPDLFKAVEEANELMARWMKAGLFPLKAEAAFLKGAMENVEDRIFSVELYAGLVEQVEKVRKGKPAEMTEPVHVMQRRHYMDEECLVDYEHGGMELKDLEAFDGWLSKEPHFGRIFPFARCLVAFQVRRNSKEREEARNLGQYVAVMEQERADKLTFLYIRNGGQLFRLSTKVEFEEKLFPDLEHRDVGFGGGKLWGRKFSGTIEKDGIITDARYQGILEERRINAEKAKRAPKKDRWKYEDNFPDNYEPFSPESVYFDDMVRLVGDKAKRHNRLVLVLQGLIDRSPVLHPHPRWSLWTAEGFGQALKLVYDESRALSAGEKPDFEAYRKGLNRLLAKGSVTVGQDDAWCLRNGEKETARRMRSYRWKSDEVVARCRGLPGDPGPGKLARVARYGRGSETCFYEWERERVITRRWEENPAKLRATFSCPAAVVLNVSAYRPGDFRRFYADPRTRAEYLKWAPLFARGRGVLCR